MLVAPFEPRKLLFPCGVANNSGGEDEFGSDQISAHQRFIYSIPDLVLSLYTSNFLSGFFCLDIMRLTLGSCARDRNPLASSVSR